MPDKSNMFWTVYKKLEKDVIDLSYYIHFSDEPTKSGHNQIWTFSNQIADLLIAISTQVESLFLELYNIEFNTKPADIGAGINAIDKKWNLSAKQVKIISIDCQVKCNKIKEKIYELPRQVRDNPSAFWVYC